ncbi:hypothetical protein V8C40DRAFT_282155 [Trichoderma camerunense]
MMASNNVFAQQDSRDSSETPSFGQGERPPFHRPPARRQSEGSSFGAESTVNNPKQTNIWAPLDNLKASFSNQLGHRLVQLLEDGTLRLGSESVMWIDENGLPTRMGLRSHGLEELERPSPHIFAGENAETTAFDNDIHTERILWRQPASEKEHSPEGGSMTFSLFNLVLIEMKSMPRITHLVWKRLRQEFEISATLGRPISERIAASRVQEAINHERKDFQSLKLFSNAFTSSESLMRIHLSIPHHSILKLAGVDPTNPDRDAALEILDDELGSSVSDIMRLAKFLQLRKVPSSWLPRGAEKLAKVVNALRAGEMGPLMRGYLETRGYLVGIDLEPPLSRGHKRRLESE